MDLCAMHAPVALLLSMLFGGEKLVICEVHGVHLAEFPQATSKEEDADSADELAVGMPSTSRSMTSSLSINTLRPRRRAKPASLGKGGNLRCDVTSSDDDSVEELGEVARVLAMEPCPPLLVDSKPRRTAGGVPDELNMGVACVGSAPGTVASIARVAKQGWRSGRSWLIQ